MARALIVGCGCRGRLLGARLLADGWQVRGTSRRQDGLASIGAAGIDAVVADPDRVDTLMDHVADVAILVLLLGSAAAEPEALAALHAERLQRLLEELVDTPVRGVVYEAAGSVEAGLLERGAAILAEARERWRIPSETVTADPQAVEPWAQAMAGAVARLVGG